MTRYHFKFVEKKNLWFSLSTVFILAGFVLMGLRFYHQQPIIKLGTDFTGGSTMVLRLSATQMKEREITEYVRSILDQKGLAQSNIQLTNDNQIIIHTPTMTNTRRQEIIQEAEVKLGHIELLEADMVGPSFGQELRNKSVWILVLVSGCLLVYIWWRFEMLFGVAAILALLHDALITISAASILNIEVNATYVAALLTILGYSINDTIVIFDRIRENLKTQTAMPFPVLANLSMNQMLVRSINTSMTTLITIVALYFFGGATIHQFALVLFVGILSGTYSSIFIATPILCGLWKRVHKEE